jgi:two-component system, OmpR family, sensor histidine kinase CpxA
MQSVERPSGLWLEHLLTEMQPDLIYEARDRCKLVLNKRGDCFVYGDAELIRSAVENVVRNAIRYSPHGSIIEITVSPEKPREAEYARIRICDQGPGVPESELNEILKPFVRIDKSRRNSTGGFGVGLSIAKRVVELHGGEIQLHNGAHSGLVVDLLFPFAQAPADNAKRSFIGSQAD